MSIESQRAQTNPCSACPWRPVSRTFTGVTRDHPRAGSRVNVDQSLQPRGGSVMFFTATPMTLFSLPSTLRK